MKKIKKIGSLLVLMLVILSFSGCGCKPASKPKYKINLEIWGLFDNIDPYEDIFQAYKKANPNIGDIKYRKLTTDSYQKDLVDALASGQGPDIFLIHNNWAPSFSEKIYPAPEDIITEQKLRADFVDVVADDFVLDGKIYALPLSVDSLGLYYNKDLFNEAGITVPPKNWDEFVDVARKLTKFNEQNQIVQSGASMGTADNINRTTDVLNLLMLQSNTQMVDVKNREAKFDKYITVDGKTYSPGEDALRFYTQFANRSSQAVPYTWNQRLHYSIDSFSEGTLGMMFNYSWQREVLDSKAPKLNYDVALIPQFPGARQINYANYWGYAVARNRTPDTKGTDAAIASKITNDMRAAEAWNLLVYMTANLGTGTVSTSGSAGSGQSTAVDFDPAKSYIEKTKKPAARRDLVELQKTDVKIGAFATGNLLAKSWYQVDPDSIETLFSQIITQINNGEIEVREAIKTAAINVTQMMGRGIKK